MTSPSKYERLLYITAIFAGFVKESFQGKHETLLYRNLLENYESLARPVANDSEAVVVTIGISFQQIVDVDEKNQIINLNVWLTYSWKDFSFKWNEKEYGGVKEIRLPPGRIWKPDVLLYNSADESFDSTYPSNVVVRSDGSMEWIPPGIIKSTCKIDITWFPFDDQHCDLKFGSWTFSGRMLDLRAGDVNNSTYTTNGEWDLMSVTPKRNSYNYYVFNMIIPCLLISFMTLLDFTLPPESGEKLSLGVTIFMSLCVFLLMVAEALPPTSDAVPLIGTYFSSVMIIVSVSVIFTVMVLNIHHRHPVTHEMGFLAKKLFLSWLPCLLLMDRPGYVKRGGNLVKISDLTDDDSKFPGIVTSSASKSLLANILDIDEGHPHILGGGMKNDAASFSSTSNYYSDGLNFSRKPAIHKAGATFGRSLDAVTTPSENDVVSGLRYAIATHLEPVLQSIYKELKLITKKLREDEEENDVINDWKFAAMVVDRLSLFAFTVVMFISTCAIIFAAPHF